MVTACTGLWSPICLLWYIGEYNIICYNEIGNAVAMMMCVMQGNLYW